MKQSITPEPGKEYIEPNEARDTEAIIDAIIKRLNRDYPPGKTLRQFHAKMHGCVKATFTVSPDIPQNSQYGFLVPDKSYEAWIRFSNGNTKVVDDRKGDLRGMAIKLLNVTGEMLLQDHTLPQSQDFLLVSYPTLMSPTVASFKKNIQALCKGTMGLVVFALNPVNWPTIIRTLQSMKKCNNVFSQQYYSVSPYRLGKPEQAVKYAAVSVAENNFKEVNKDKDFLRKQMRNDLTTKTVQIDFMIQLQEDAVTMPIENPCIEWKSPWHKVASIEIHPQNFDTPDQIAFGENLTFSPWHCLKEHQPLGGINRAR
ncbi:MAG: hypothetical protein JWQ09_1310, partial [Segetibacter sp.]|nr:hypothetical protein [Segetibacter sp.]